MSSHMEPDGDEGDIELEVSLSDMKEEALHRIIRSMAKRKSSNRPGMAAKLADEEYEDGEACETCGSKDCKGCGSKKSKRPQRKSENDDLVDLHRETKGDSKPPEVMSSDLPEDVRKAMTSKGSYKRG